MPRQAPDLERAARAIEEFLDALGVPVTSDPELRETGRRVADAFAHDLLEGYSLSPAQILAEATSSTASGLVVVTGIATTAICPHHLLPASGVVHVGYFPGAKVVGLGALARLVDCFARRLILQEDLGQRVADALVEHLGARGAGVVVDLVPTCVTARGGRRHGAHAVTSAFAGELARDGAARQELLASIAIARGLGPAMRAEPAPLTETELDALPIFPLPRVVLLPGGVLPLHIFEPRYRAMIEDCVSQGPSAIAMAMLAPGWERDYEGRPKILPIAGAGRIVAHRRNADGTHDLVLHGVARVRLDERVGFGKPYRVARAIPLDDDEGRDPAALRRALEPVLAAAASLAALEKRGMVAPTDLDGPVGLVVDRLADRWVHDAGTRQQILETVRVSDRIARVGDSMMTLLARLAASSGSSN